MPTYGKISFFIASPTTFPKIPRIVSADGPPAFFINFLKRTAATRKRGTTASLASVHWLGDVQRDGHVTQEEPFSATFKLNKETRNTLRYAEEAEEQRPIVGTVYVEVRATEALNLAGAAEAAGFQTVVIDLDPQASAKSWHDQRNGGAPVVVSAHASLFELPQEEEQEADS